MLRHLFMQRGPNLLHWHGGRNVLFALWWVLLRQYWMQRRPDMLHGYGRVKILYSLGRQMLRQHVMQRISKMLRQCHLLFVYSNLCERTLFGVKGSRRPQLT
jgi:hypothetical protein